MARLLLLVLVAFFVYEESMALVPVNKKLLDFFKNKFSPLIPITDPDHPLSVSMQVSVQSIENVDREKNHVEVNLWVFQLWNTGITWDPKDYNNLAWITLPNRVIWRPDLFLRNAAGKAKTHSPPILVAMSNGVTGIHEQIRVTLACDVSDDTCFAQFQSFTMNNEHLVLTGMPPMFDLTGYMARWANHGGRFQQRDGKLESAEVSYEGFPEKASSLIYRFSVRDTHAHYRRGPSKLMFKWY